MEKLRRIPVGHSRGCYLYVMRPVKCQSNLLFIFGASARAAAFSATRADLCPWCADLFADRDLQLRCQAARVASEDYPNAFRELASQDATGPWMYTGGLENCPRLLGQIAGIRPLWGNAGKPLLRSRTPQFVTSLLKEAHLAHPRIQSCSSPPQEGAWLVKPIHGAGGAGIKVWTGREISAGSQRKHYLQEYIDGEPCAAVYLGDGARAQFLGVTRQLVGATWLHAGPFQYCGSVGPLSLAPGLQVAFEKIGAVLTNGCQLRGLFDVDCIVRDKVPFPVEINPRYTASVEVLEYAGGFAALAAHRAVFDPTPSIQDEPTPAPPSVDMWPTRSASCIGKAILFAKEPLIFPDSGPWSPTIQMPVPVHELPAFADIPWPGEPIERGGPILTFFTRAASPSQCVETLRQIARDLDRWLFRR